MHSCAYVQQVQPWRHYGPSETQADGYSLSGDEERGGLEEKEVGKRGGRAGERHDEGGKGKRN